MYCLMIVMNLVGIVIAFFNMCMIVYDWVGKLKLEAEEVKVNMP